MLNTTSSTYFADTRAQAVFAADGAHPQFLMDTPKFKVLVVGLEPGGQIPVHPAEAAMYHFLDGDGLMTVGEETFAVRAGVTITVASGIARGVNARTRLIFLGSKGEE